MILLHAASDHLVAVSAGRTVRLDLTLDALFVADDPAALLRSLIAAAPSATLPAHPRAPLQSQEVWAAGVTYFRSMTARKEESKDSGGGTFYDRVYHADRPEIFFKSTPHRVAAPGTPVRIRADSKWNVPEPELTLAINSAGKIFGYTIGNDMSSRDIEGENPLYLPQAKVYDRRTAPAHHRNLHRDPPRRRRRFLRRDDDQPDQAHLRLARGIPLSRQLLPARLLPHDRHRRRPARQFHPALR